MMFSVADRSIAPRSHTSRRNQDESDGTDKDSTSGQEKWPVVRWLHQTLSNDRRHDTEDATEEARNTGRCSSDGRRKSFGGPAVKDRVEHALEKVLHGVETNIGSFSVDGGEEEERDTHECG